jgi:hypothetical protein
MGEMASKIGDHHNSAGTTGMTFIFCPKPDLIIPKIGAKENLPRHYCSEDTGSEVWPGPARLILGCQNADFGPSAPHISANTRLIDTKFGPNVDLSMFKLGAKLQRHIYAGSTDAGVIYILYIDGKMGPTGQATSWCKVNNSSAITAILIILGAKFKPY